MKIYLVLYLLVILLCFLEINYSVIRIGNYTVKTKYMSFVILYSYILLLGIFRGEFLGVDVSAYKEYYFDRSQNESIMDILKRGGDFGYNLVNRLIAYITNDFWKFKAVLYLITFSIYSFVMIKRTAFVSVSYFIYISLSFIGLNFCILRQALAMSICFYAYRFAKEKRIYKFLFWVLVAASMHRTAFCFILVYALSNLKIKETYWKPIICIGSAFILGYWFMPLIIRLYAANDYSSHMIKGEGTKILFFYAVLLVGVYYFGGHMKKLQKDCEAGMGMLYLQIGAMFFSLFHRVTYYYSIILTTLIPNILEKYKKRNAIAAMLILMLSILYFWGLYSNSFKIVPYQSIFNN